MERITLYNAGGLFNVGERLHNSLLEKKLKSTADSNEIDLHITLPQRTALNRFISSKKGFDVNGIVYDCMQDAAGHDFILCNLDGPDADSGTSSEYGIALGQKIAFEKLNNESNDLSNLNVPKIITYRTDFRTDPKKEVGVNAMLKAQETSYIYYPCYVIEFEGFEKFYSELAKKIIEEILSLKRD
jgi:nucleoside 2-deoxyribosyltransferase